MAKDTERTCEWAYLRASVPGGMMAELKVSHRGRPQPEQRSAIWAANTNACAGPRSMLLRGGRRNPWRFQRSLVLRRKSPIPSMRECSATMLPHEYRSARDSLVAGFGGFAWARSKGTDNHRAMSSTLRYRANISSHIPLHSFDSGGEALADVPSGPY
jgi:hypothetical protein